MATSTIREVEPGANGATAGRGNGRGKGRGAGRAGNRSTPPAPLLTDDGLGTLEDPEDDAPEPAAAAPATHASQNARGEQDYWEWLSNFTADDWTQLMAYVYRTAPQIDRKKMGQHLYITKYVQPFDIETLKQNHGSGGYRIDLVRTGGNGGSFRISREYFHVLDINFPPRVAMGEWIEAPENNDWAWAKEQLMKEQAERRATNPAIIGGDGAQGLAQTILSHVEKIRPSNPENQNATLAMIQGMNQMQAHLLAASDPKKQFELIGLLLPMFQHKAPTGPDPLIQMLMDDRKAMREQISDLTKMITAQASTPRKSLREEITEMMTVAKMMSPKTAAAPDDANTSQWMDIANKVLDHAPTFLAAFMNGRAAPPAATAPRPQTQGFPPRPNAVAPTAENTPAAAPAAAPEGDQANMPQVSTEQQARFEQILATYGELIQQVSAIMIDKYRAGETGYEFRDWFIDRKGIDNYNSFRDGCTAEDLTALAQTHPVLKVALAPQEKLIGFLTEFFTMPGDEPEDDDNKEPAE
jgi:hypothetical protein